MAGGLRVAVVLLKVNVRKVSERKLGKKNHDFIRFFFFFDEAILIMSLVLICGYFNI